MDETIRDSFKAGRLIHQQERDAAWAAVMQHADEFRQWLAGHGMELRISAESRHWMIFDANGSATHWWPTSGKAKLPNGSRANIATLLQLREKLESINTP